MTGYRSNTRMDLPTQAQLTNAELQYEVDQVYAALRALHIGLSAYESPASITLEDVTGKQLLDFYQLNSGSRLLLQAGTTISPGDFVGVRADDSKIERINARAPTKYTTCSVGWAINAAEVDKPVIVYAAPAVLPFFSGLTPGFTYGVLANNVLQDMLSGTGLPVGLAISPTTMRIFTGAIVYEWM